MNNKKEKVLKVRVKMKVKKINVYLARFEKQERLKEKAIEKEKAKVQSIETPARQKYEWKKGF